MSLRVKLRNSVVRAHPKITVAIFENAADRATGEPFLPQIHRERTRLWHNFTYPGIPERYAA